MDTTGINKTTASSKHYNDGFAFRFRFPDHGLTFHAVSIDDGKPSLHFDPSLNVPNITEEDVAVCARLSQEKKRPEFFYIPLPNLHPFYGRKYKQYRPGYLRGTSVGEVLAEADWLMKCLDAGVRSDETKTTFCSWEEKSQLRGLATNECFSAESASGSVIMSCKYVEVLKSDDKVVFENPKMTINANHQPSYSKYITEWFDSIAHHDAPLFLKVKELIKLILAMEWLNEKGVKFSNEWINEHFDRSQKCPRQAVAVKSPKMSQEIVQYALDQLGLRHLIDVQSLRQETVECIPAPYLSSLVPVRATVEVNKILTEEFFQLKIAHKRGPPANTENIRTLTISLRDFDILYEKMDPNAPVGLDNDGKLIVPNVDSWSSLFTETVPTPCKLNGLSEMTMVEAVFGGVTTASIPVHEKVTTKTDSAVRNSEVIVTASSSRQRSSLKRSQIPTPSIVKPPPRDVPCEAHQKKQKVMKKSGSKSAFGYAEPSSVAMSDGNGTSVKQQSTVRCSIRQETFVNSQRWSRVTTNTQHPLPPVVSETNEVENQREVESHTNGHHSTDMSECASQEKSESPPQSHADAKVNQPQRESLKLPLTSSPAEQPVSGKESPTGSEDSGIAGSIPQLPPGIDPASLLSPTGTDDSGIGLSESRDSSMSTNSD